MTFAQAHEFLAKHPKVPVSCPTLVGYQLQTHDLPPRDPHSELFLAKAIQDCDGTYGRRMPYKLAEAPNGTLTLWTLPPEPEEY